VKIYDDGRVACTDREIIIRRYYGRRHRRINYQAIREVRQVPLSAMSKIMRIHGSKDQVHWFNFDPDRPHKNLALVIYLDDDAIPVITPDHPDQVIAELAAHGVTVTIGQGDEEADFEANVEPGPRPRSPHRDGPPLPPQFDPDGRS
jgi:hypothetical protein